MPTASQIIFRVDGLPIPKQSFRFSKFGNYQPERLVAWQNNVAVCARQAVLGAAPFLGAVMVELTFALPDRRRRDLDNLSKGVLDAMRQIVYHDDTQIVDLLLHKRYGKQPGVVIVVEAVTVVP